MLRVVLASMHGYEEKKNWLLNKLLPMIKGATRGTVIKLY